MPTEVWFRNPHSYIRELVECGEYKIAWDRGTLTKKRVDPHKHALLYYGLTYPFRLLVVGEQGTAELDAIHDLTKPKAVYPTWSYGEDLHALEDMLANPVGEDLEVCSTKGVEPDELPVYGQEHRVIVSGLPAGNLSIGRAFLRTLKELQEDYPEAIIHLHGPYSWNVAFGTGMRSADVEPRIAAQKGKVTLPNGSEVMFERTFNKAQWTKAVGFEPGELKVPRNRCMFNIKSAVWAGAHYDELFRFRTRKTSAIPIDIRSSDTEHTPIQTNNYKSVMAKAKPGDQFTCNTCSLMDECKYFREGAVCSVPSAEPASLTTYFGTRDSGLILDGLAILMKSGIKRYERGLRNEEVTGELDKEVSKVQTQLFDQGIKLAKLLDPALRAPKVQVQVGGGSAVQVNTGSPRQAIAAAFRELEARGIPREEITSEMIAGVFESMGTAPDVRARAIEGTVVEARRDNGDSS